MRAAKNSDLHIQHQCPQCGAPATLLESDRLFVCAYCRVTSYLMTRGVSQYHLPQKSETGGRQTIYFPYWRFKGMLFSCLARDTQAHFIDTSHQACHSPHFPATLGLRSQALTLHVVTADTAGYFIRPQASLADVMPIFVRRSDRALRQPPLHHAHIGETVSLIYAPYYLEGGVLIDAVLEQPAGLGKPSGFRIDDYRGGPPVHRFDFLPTLCPNCGWDLDGRRDSLVLSCRHCRSLWQPGRGGFAPVPCAHVPTSDRNVVYLPFWRIRAEVSGAALDSYADLVRLANLPKTVRNAWERMPFRFWSPAFKVRPRVFLRLMQVLSTALPPENLVRNAPAQPCFTANLPLGEATETLKPNLSVLIKPLERMAALLPAIRITPRRALLVYLPFEDRPHELVAAALRLAVHKNQLSLASNL